MDAIREQMNKPLVMGAVGLVLGLILGIIYAWVISPVEWTDASISHLRADLKEDYLRMAITAYGENKDVDVARRRYDELGEDKEQYLQAVLGNPAQVNPQAILDFQLAVAVQGQPEATEAEKEGSSIWGTLLTALCLVVILGGGVGGYIFYQRNRADRFTSPEPALEDQVAVQPSEWTDYESIGTEAPMVQFMASYRIGDDLFDDSFSIDSPSGEFLGECGVGISETIGVGEPKRVTAFEVWLFDKNDIQTVTKVIMSAHAFLDEATRQRLAAKGEPVLAEPGNELVLETQSLRLVARVVDMGYGDGALPENSFFDRLLLELAVWEKV